MYIYIMYYNINILLAISLRKSMYRPSGEYHLKVLNLARAIDLKQIL